MSGDRPGLAEAWREPLASALEALGSSRPSTRPLTRVVRGDHQRIWGVVTDDLIARVRFEYVGFDDPSVLAADGMTESMLVRGSAAMRGVLARGVRVHQLTTDAGLAANSEEHPAVQDRWGGQVRVVPHLPFKACVFDRRVAAIPLDLSSLLRGMVVTTDPLLIGMVLAAHRSGWRLGAGPRETLPAHLRDVLDLMVSGVPDDRAADRAGLSARTYSRRVAELMELLGARSRFQAGVEAAHRGWTRPQVV